MTLGLLLAVGAFGAASSGWALGRDGSTARVGAVLGVVALALVGLLAAASPTPAGLTPDADGAVPGTLWNGALVPGGYFRLVIVLWSAVSVVLALLAWLLRGVAALRGLLPAALAALTGASVALTAARPELGVVAAAATGLAAVPAILASPRVGAAGMAAREVRVAVATALVVLAVVAVVPVVARLILANPDGPAGPAAGQSPAVAFALLAMALAVAARTGAIPWHIRVSALTDTVSAGALPLVIAWLPLPLAVVSAGVVASLLVPLAPKAGSAQALIVAAVLISTLAAALVAFVQDDLRHASGYLVIADLGLAVLALAALDPGVWGPVRTWLLAMAVTKSALIGWAAVVEARFATRSVPELRGWLRPSPLLGIALLLVVLATFGLPGWAIATARLDLTGRAAGAPWNAMLLVASLLTLPAYLRWLWVGVGAPTSHVDRVAPELGSLGSLPARRLGATPPAKGRLGTLPVEQEGAGSTAAARDDHAGQPGTATREARVRRRGGGNAELVKRHRAGLLSGAVLALALLATFVASGGFDVARAACEPVPAVPTLEASCS